MLVVDYYERLPFGLSLVSSITYVDLGDCCLLPCGVVCWSLVWLGLVAPVTCFVFGLGCVGSSMLMFC